eukprot:symbB.v1.2.019088.t1/scaffold1547.1/size112433/9
MATATSKTWREGKSRLSRNWSSRIRSCYFCWKRQGKSLLGHAEPPTFQSAPSPSAPRHTPIPAPRAHNSARSGSKNSLNSVPFRPHGGFSPSPGLFAGLPLSNQTRASPHAMFTTKEQEENAHRDIAASKAGAIQRQRYADIQKEDRTEVQASFITRMVTHPAFDLFFSLVVLTNSAYIGVEVQYSMQDLSQAGQVVFDIIGSTYTVAFTLELVLRIWGYGCRDFFCKEDWAWSILDVFVVATSLSELVLIILAVVNQSDGESLSGITSLKAFRIIRMTRLLKTVRLMRIFRFVLALRMLITSILHTLKSLFWALVLLLLIVYVFAVLFVQAVHEYRSDFLSSLTVEENDALERYFDSLASTMITLFMSIANGVSWENVLYPLMKISPFWVLCFLFFVSFTYFAVLNVITAVFCESAIESAQQDQFTLVQSILADKENHLEKVRELFVRLGATSATGSITFQMLEESINSDAVHEYFQSLGLDIWDAWTFFRLLDADGGGEVEVEEFLMGCLRLRGPATAIDMGKVIRDQNWLVQTVGRFSAYVESELSQVKVMLGQLSEQ